LKDYPFNKEKHQMTKWNTTIAAASLLAALGPGVALAQVVEYVDGQGQKHQVGSRAPGLSSPSQPGDVPSLSSETSGQDREPASHKPKGGQRVCRSTAGCCPEEGARKSEEGLPLGARST